MLVNLFHVDSETTYEFVGRHNIQFKNASVKGEKVEQRKRFKVNRKTIKRNSKV